MKPFHVFQLKSSAFYNNFLNGCHSTFICISLMCFHLKLLFEIYFWSCIISLEKYKCSNVENERAKERLLDSQKNWQSFYEQKKKSPIKNKNLEERQIFYQFMFVVRKKYIYEIKCEKDVFDISQETYISFLKLYIFFLRYLHCLYLNFFCLFK